LGFGTLFELEGDCAEKLERVGSPGAAAAGGAVLIFGTDEGAVAAAGKGVVEQFGKRYIYALFSSSPYFPEIR
jgi:hypothetical protein